MIKPEKDKTNIRIFMENSEQVAISTVETPNRNLTYEGHTYIDGVTLPSAPISLEFDTLKVLYVVSYYQVVVKDEVDGYSLTMIDNGMPCVIIEADQLGLNDDETGDELEKNSVLRDKLESLAEVRKDYGSWSC